MQENAAFETGMGQVSAQPATGSPDPTPGAKTISDCALAGDAVPNIIALSAKRVIPNLIKNRMRLR